MKKYIRDNNYNVTFVWLVEKAYRSKGILGEKNGMEQMTVPSLEIAEVYANGTKLIKRNTFVDDRGEFDRLFTTHDHLSDFGSFHVKDVNISSSYRSVLRGMHFQNAPSLNKK